MRLASKRVYEDLGKQQEAGIGLQSNHRPGCPMGVAVGDEPRRLGRQRGAKGPIDDGLERSVEEQGVVHESDAAADVVDRVAWESTPRSAAERVTHRRPLVDRHRAVAEGGDRSLKSFRLGSPGLRVDNQSGVEGSCECLVTEPNGSAKKVWGRTSTEAEDPCDRTERFGREGELVVGFGA